MLLISCKKNRHTYEKRHNRKYLKPNIHRRNIDEQHCVYITLSCSSI